MRFYDFNRSPIKCPGGTESRKYQKPLPTSCQTTSRKDVDATNDDQNKDGDEADEMTGTVVDVNDDDDINFDDNDYVDVDDDGPGIIQDDITDDDELLPNLDDKDES